MAARCGGGPLLTLRGSYPAMRMKLKVDGDGDQQIQVMPLVWSSTKARVVGVSEARIGGRSRAQP